MFSFSKTSDYWDIMYPAWTFWEGGPALGRFPLLSITKIVRFRSLENCKIYQIKIIGRSLISIGTMNSKLLTL